MKDGLKYRTNPKNTWRQDSMCLTAEDATQVVNHYRQAYSPARFAWLMGQSCRDTPFDDCRKVFEDAVT